MTKDATAIHANDAQERIALGDEIRYYLSLTPRQLPSKYLYDPLGSVLFDAITHLPWYSPTRAESRLLERHAAEIFRAVPGVRVVLELGPGNGHKLSALIRRGATAPKLDVRLIDVSATALEAAVASVSRAYDVSVVSYVDTYEAGLERFAADRGTERALVLFLGSNIGNFDPPGREAFLRTIRASLRPGDALLLGTDLVKSERDLLLAYDDPLGVTAAFNLNLLVRLNRDLQADFDLAAFAHEARWNAGHHRIEMHLVSRRRQTIHVAGAGLEFTLDEGETIWTESSYKFRPEAVAALVHASGFGVREQWIDAAEPFALTLAEAVECPAFSGPPGPA